MDRQEFLKRFDRLLEEARDPESRNAAAEKMCGLLKDVGLPDQEASDCATAFHQLADRGDEVHIREFVDRSPKLRSLLRELKSQW